MSPGGKLLGRCLVGQQCDSPTVGDATRGSDLVRIFDRNSLRLRECLEPNGAILGITLNGSNRRQFLAVGLGDVEHIG
jgi:hypothetical protein